MKSKAIKGKFYPKNPKKYTGDVNKIIYRSLWERRFMLYCDRSDQILNWSSEEIHIPYVSPKDDRWHNYYPDFVVDTCYGRTIVVEIKPHYQRWWAVNVAKWNAARKYCDKRSFEFKVLTEKELF